MTSRVFTAYGQPLALNPRAFGMLIFEPPAPPAAQHLDGGIALIEVQGPLMHHPDPCADSYDAIKARVLEALKASPAAIVLSIDSPGGLVSGCFDTADEIRAACDAVGVELVSYVDGQATSAAYALACVASKVYVPPTGIVGSIGVIDALVDATAQDAALGLQYSIVASGARKTDGNVHAATTDAAVASAQARVDGLASIFFEHVAKRRPIAADAVAAMQAGLFVGADAQARGLADAVLTLDQVLALVRAGADAADASAQPSNTEMSTMDDNEKAYRASLQAILDDEDADEKAKAKAKAILAAMDGEPDGDEEKPEGKAEGDEEKPHEEPDGDEAKATSIAARALALAEATRRDQLLASRPDLTADQRKALAAVPVSALESALRAIPRANAKPAATASVPATRGEGQGSTPTAPTLTPDADLDRAFGTAKAESPIRKDPSNPLRTYFGVLSREQAKAITAKHNGGAL